MYSQPDFCKVQPFTLGQFGTINLNLKRYYDTSVTRIELGENGIVISEKSNKKLERPQTILGWNRTIFPSCCGIDMVYNLPQCLDPNMSENLEIWFKWAMSRMDKAAIGVIPMTFGEPNDGTYKIITSYTWIASKGIPIGPPVKNPSYYNHVLQFYIWVSNVERMMTNIKFEYDPTKIKGATDDYVYPGG